jgi:hypothetical protein
MAAVLTVSGGSSECATSIEAAPDFLLKLRDPKRLQRNLSL